MVEAGERTAVITGGMSASTTVRAVIDAERRGCEAAFVSEVGLGADAMVCSTAALLATRSIQVGPGIANVADRHPLALARAAAALDRLAPGRALLGIGRGDPGYVDHALEELGRGAGLGALEDALRICRAALSGERVDWQGRRWSAHIDPAPESARAHHPVPLLLAAVGPRTLQLAGALADGVLLNYGCSPEYVRWAVERVTEGAVGAGRDAAAAIGVYAHVLVAVTDAPDGDRQLAAVRRTLASVLHTPGQGEALAVPLGGVPAVLDDAALARFAAVGPAAAVRERLAAYRVAGVSCVVLAPSALQALLPISRAGVAGGR